VADQWQGFSIELLREIGRASGIEFELVPESWTFISAEFQAGRLDALANVMVTEERRQTMDFSIGHASVHAVSYHRPGTPPFEKTSQLAGKTIAMLSGSMAHLDAVAHGGWGARLVLFRSFREVLEAVKRGDCDCAVLLRRMAVEQPDELGLQRAFVDDITYQYHIAVQRGDRLTLERINDGLATVRHNGTFDRLYAKWIGPIEPHPIRLADLRPYAWPTLFGALLVTILFVWQHFVNRRLAQQSEALHDMNTRYVDLTRRVPVGIYTLRIRDDGTQHFEYGSEKFYQLLGLTEQDLRAGPKPAFEAIHPDDRASRAEANQAAAKNFRPFRWEGRVMVRGETRWVRFESDPTRLPNGDALWNGVIMDITERKQADEQLRKLSRIIEQAPLSVVITNLQADIEYVNPKFCAVSGYAPEEVIGQNARILKSGVMPPQIYRDLWQALGRQQVWTGELQNRKKNGELYLENAVIAPVIDAGGRATHYVALKDDVTAQKRYVAETTAMLEKERQISAMKTRFIAVTSHEFRTPMAAAMGSVEILSNHLDNLAPTKRRELLDRINAALRRMTEMLNEILFLNRADSNQVNVRLVPADFRGLAQNVIDEQRLANKESHRYDLQAAGELSAIMTDPNLQHHILANLLDNAARYSPVGTLITVRLTAAAAQIRLEVEDQGIGIPPGDRARTFQPFERGSNVGTIRGTGLGLNIVRRMCDLLGGTITYEPVLSGGSRFIVIFPLHPASSRQPVG
jgi:PAS domain S-box-containing protein